MSPEEQQKMQTMNSAMQDLQNLSGSRVCIRDDLPKTLQSPAARGKSYGRVTLPTERFT